MKYRIKKGLIFEKKGNDITIFDSNNSVLIELNESANYILNKIKKGLNEKEIINVLVKKYDITHNVASKDLEELIKKLRKNKILTIKLNLLTRVPTMPVTGPA